MTHPIKEFVSWVLQSICFMGSGFILGAILMAPEICQP